MIQNELTRASVILQAYIDGIRPTDRLPEMDTAAGPDGAFR